MSECDQPTTDDLLACSASVRPLFSASGAHRAYARLLNLENNIRRALSQEKAPEEHDIARLHALILQVHYEI